MAKACSPQRYLHGRHDRTRIGLPMAIQVFFGRVDQHDTWRPDTTGSHDVQTTSPLIHFFFLGQGHHDLFPIDLCPRSDLQAHPDPFPPLSSSVALCQTDRDRTCIVRDQRGHVLGPVSGQDGSQSTSDLDRPLGSDDRCPYSLCV